MFRRSKDQDTPPAPPTFAQILEDLKTFEVERPAPPTEVRHLDEPGTSAAAVAQPDDNNTAATRDANLSQWWNAFETFRHDAQELHRLRRKMIGAKEELALSNDQLVDHVAAARRRIKEGIDMVPVNDE